MSARGRGKKRGKNKFMTENVTSEIALPSEGWNKTSQRCQENHNGKSKETDARKVQNSFISAGEKDYAQEKCSPIHDESVSSRREWSQTSHSCEKTKETDAPVVKDSCKLAGENICCRDTKSDNISPENEEFSNQKQSDEHIEEIEESLQNKECSNRDNSEEVIEESLQRSVRMADLTCSACLEPFKDPKVLPCFHSYCHGCIVNLIKNTNIINCPKCRLAVKVDENAVSALPSNFFVNNLLAAMVLTNDKPSAKKILCENCNSKDPTAESRCNECGIFLCQYCTESHKRYRSTEHHKLFSMEELKSNSRPQTIAQKIRCQKHKEEIIKLFCKTCQTTICRDCTIVDHRQHEYEFVEQVAFKEKQHLQSNLNGVKLRKCRVLQGIANLKNFNKGLEDKKNSTISEINKHFDELVKAAESRKREMIQKATSLTNSKQKQIRGQLEVLELALVTCESSIDFTELAFSNGNDVQILSMEKNILQSLLRLNAVKDQTEPSVTEDMMFFIPSSVNETKTNLLNKYDVDISRASPENCHAYFNKVETDLERKKEESEIKEDKNDNEGEMVYDYPEELVKDDWSDAEKSFEEFESVERVETIKEKQVKIDNKCDDEHKAERFMGAGKQYSITVICKNRNNRKLRYGGQDVKPSFTGITVNDVSVTDNKDGSYTISFCPCQVGMLKFKVSINGTPAPNCSLEKQVNWRISDIYGKGIVTDGGMTMKGDGPNFCCRVGWCCFESGVNTWKVQLSNHDKSCNYRKNCSYEVGIIDHDEINADIITSENKWVFKHSVQYCRSDVISLTLDMERRRLNIRADSNRCYGPTALRFTARRVLPFFACDSPNASISLVE